MELVFLLEEPSMKAFLEVLLPRVVPGIRHILIPHEGKTDLEKSIPRKIRGWNNEMARFIILRDQHSHPDCRKLKSDLLGCKESANEVLIRVVCKELESWLLGDLSAVEAAFPGSRSSHQSNKAKFRSPDNLTNAADELSALIQYDSKVKRASAIASHLSIEGNRSRSFQMFLSELQRITNGQCRTGQTRFDWEAN